MTARQEAKLTRTAAKNPDLSYRDLADLLMEHGADSNTARRMALGRPHSPGEN